MEWPWLMMCIFQTHAVRVLRSSVCSGLLGFVLCCPWAASLRSMSPWQRRCYMKADKAFSGYLHRDAAWWKALIQHTVRKNREAVSQSTTVRLLQLPELITITALLFWLSAHSLGFVSPLSFLTDTLCSLTLELDEKVLNI